MTDDIDKINYYLNGNQIGNSFNNLMDWVSHILSVRISDPHISVHNSDENSESLDI